MNWLGFGSKIKGQGHIIAAEASALDAAIEFLQLSVYTLYNLTFI